MKESSLSNTVGLPNSSPSESDCNIAEDFLAVDLHSVLESLGKELGFYRLHWIDLKAPLSIEKYRLWLEKGMNGEMKYLSDHLDTKTHPEKLLSNLNTQARSIIVGSMPYFPAKNDRSPFSFLKTAAYSKGKDYHLWLRENLETVAQRLQNYLPEAKFLVGTDALPILERDFGFQAGIGWIGKNTCLIDSENGSLFFIGEILCSVSAPATTGEKLTAQTADDKLDFCGTCTRCIDACPTGAIESPRELNAEKCISYWTIEAKTVPPVDIRKKMDGWFFGCDICQTVCPWNRKKFGEALLQANEKKFAKENFTSVTDSVSGSATDSITASDLRPHHSDLRSQMLQSFKFILESSGKNLTKLVHETPLNRARPRGLKRNALLGIAHYNLTELSETVSHYQKDEHLGELAKWVSGELKR